MRVILYSAYPTKYLIGMRKYMNKYENGEFVLYSDFEIRTLREDGNDVDLFIPLDLRVLNLSLDKMPSYIDDRFQFNEVRSIIIRISMDEGNNYCTIHLLRSVDLLSAIMNFSMDYKNSIIKILRNEYSVDMEVNSNDN